MSMKTLKVMVVLEIRGDIDDDDAVRDSIKDALAESIEDDSLDYTVDEMDEEDDLF